MADTDRVVNMRVSPMRKGTAVIAVPINEGTFIMVDKLAVSTHGDLLPNQQKVAIVNQNLVLALWGVGSISDQNGNQDLLLLQLVSQYFAEHSFTGSNEQFAKLDAKWAEWFLGYCDRNKRYPAPQDGGIWAQFLLVFNATTPHQVFLLDFLYTRNEKGGTLEVKHLDITGELAGSTFPRIYGCFSRHLDLAKELAAKIQENTATNAERETFLFLAGMWPRDMLELPLAIRCASFVMRDIHVHDRDRNGNLHVGDTVDITLLPLTGNAEFKAQNQSIL